MKNEKTVEFNLENIQNGKYAESLGKKSGNWNMFNSIRLLKESGQEIPEDFERQLVNMKYKWTYNNRRSDNDKGNFIIKFHIKNNPDSFYAVANIKTKTLKQYATLEEAKANIEK